MTDVVNERFSDMNIAERCGVGRDKITLGLKPYFSSIIKSVEKLEVDDINLSALSLLQSPMSLSKEATNRFEEVAHTASALKADRDSTKLVHSIRAGLSDSMRLFMHDFADMVASRKSVEATHCLEFLNYFRASIKKAPISNAIKSVSNYYDFIKEKEHFFRVAALESLDLVDIQEYSAAEKKLSNAEKIVRDFPHLSTLLVSNYKILMQNVIGQVDADIASLEAEDALSKVNMAINLMPDMPSEVREEALSLLKDKSLSIADISLQKAYMGDYADSHAIIRSLDDENVSVIDLNTKDYAREAAKIMGSHSINFAQNKEVDVSRKIMSAAQEMFPEHRYHLRDARLELSARLSEHIEGLVSEKDYKEALSLLRDNEKTLWNGKKEDLRQRCANIITHHAIECRNPSETERINRWASKFLDHRTSIFEKIVKK